MKAFSEQLEVVRHSGERFTGFLEPHACFIAFVLQHGSERRPPGVKHGLSHVCLGQAGRVHVANEDGPVLSSQVRRKLAQEIFPAVRDLGVDRPGAVPD